MCSRVNSRSGKCLVREMSSRGCVSQGSVGRGNVHSGNVLESCHLREHKFKHSFRDTLNPLCSCGLDIETTSHYFLRCPLFHDELSTLLNNINEIDSPILSKNESVVIRILLYGDKSFKNEVNLLILNATIDFVLCTNSLMNHFIFSEFTVVFPFIHNYTGTIL